MQDVRHRHEVVVVGGGQAGLAIGYFLAHEGRDFVILEAADEPAAAWRKRWDSLRLFTPARYSGLPGRVFPGEPDRYPSRDEVASYLATYARELDLPVRFKGRVRALRQAGGGSTPGRIRRRGVGTQPRAVAAAGSTVTFADGGTLDVGAVIWATGYRSDYSWIDPPVFDDRGLPVHRRGVTESPGLYFLGLTWQHTRGSALIGWVKDDAEYMAERIGAYQESKARPSVRTPVGAGASAQARSDERS